MQKYKYTAVNLQNKKIKGTFIAQNERDLAEQLAKQSLYLVSATLYSGKTPNAFFTLGTGKVSLAEMTTFCRQFSIMLNTSIPLLDCVDILMNQNYSSYFKKILEVIYDDVKGGMVLSEALKKHGTVFPDFFRSMVYVGEMSGKLDLVFESLADYYEKDSELKKKIWGALSYPIMLMGMTVALVVAMLFLIVPKFKETLGTLEVEPNPLTAAVYNLSDFVMEWWAPILSVVMIVGILIFLGLLTEKGKYVKDVLLVKLPLIRKIQINTATARFARSFALLLSSGMDLNEALDVVEIVMTNRYMKNKLRISADNVRHGMSLTNAFEAERLFPSMMTKMITIGEMTNSLDDVLTRSCKFFDSQVEAALNSFASKIQPIMLIIMGAAVAVMFIAVYSPILSIMGGLS